MVWGIWTTHRVSRRVLRRVPRRVLPRVLRLVLRRGSRLLARTLARIEGAGVGEECDLAGAVLGAGGWWRGDSDLL